MKCPETIRLLDAYVDDELEVSGVLVLEEHLRECSRCRAREESLRALRAALHRHAEYRVAPAALGASIRRRFEGRDAPRAAPARGRLAIGAAALGGLALAVWGGWQGGTYWTEARPARSVSKVVYHISDSRTASAALRTLRNHLEASPATRVVVVAHNEGVDFLLRGALDEDGKPYEAALRPFSDRGVEFRVCNNTLVRRKIEGAGLAPGATLVTSGIAEIERLQHEEGFSYLRM